MTDRQTDDRDLIETIRPLIEAMPQPEPIIQVAAFFQGVALASGLDKEDIAQAAAIFLTTLYNEYAQVMVHHRDGSFSAFQEQDFQHDIRPGSPYYTSE